MAKKRKKDTAYRAAVNGAKSVLRILVYICVILAIVLPGKQPIVLVILFLISILWRQRKKKVRM